MSRKQPNAKYQIKVLKVEQCPLCHYLIMEKLIGRETGLHCINSLTGGVIVESCEHLAGKNMMEKIATLAGFCKTCLTKETSESHREEECRELWRYPGQKCNVEKCYKRSSLCLEHEKLNKAKNKKKQKGFLSCGIDYLI